MTELDLFPRGKPSTESSKTNTARSPNSAHSQAKGEQRSKKDDCAKAGRKRKAPGAAAPNVSGGKDWLFGSPQQQFKGAGTSSKKKRAEDGTGGSRTPLDKKSAVASGEVGSGMLVHQAGRAPRLEMVSFKKLTKGTLTLGVVYKVNEHDMVVSLPSSLTGVVRKKEISDLFHAKAGTGGGRKNNHGGRGRYFDEGAAGDTSLTDMFHEGQVVRCAILSLAKEVGGRHIELSLRASVVNKGLSLSQLAAGCGVYGSVVSVEDHGYVVSLGLEGVTAFLPLKEAPDRGLHPGQPVESVIKAVKAAARTVTLSAEAHLVAAAVTRGTAFDLRSLKPGMLVDTIVDNVLSNGMLVSFLGYFAGCVDHNNMPVVSGDSREEQKGWRSLYKSGPEPVRARVLMVDYVNKAIRLTLRPHLLDMRAPSGLPLTGALLDAEVVRVDPALGLLLKVPSIEGDGGSETTGNIPPPKKEKGQARRERRAKAAAEAAAAAEKGGAMEEDNTQEVAAATTGHSVGAYVHISRISDERVEHVERLYKPGQQVLCRVTGSSLVEGWSAVSLRASVLAAAVLRYQDLRPGTLIEGEIAAVEAFGLLVKLGEGVRALVPKNHLGDVGVKNPKARFKVGARVKGRVLSVDARSSKATMTLKRSLTKDKRDPLTSYDEAKEGVACTGFVTKVASFGLHISFYGNLFGLIPKKALSRHGIEEPSEAFTVGQVVGCVVRRCDTSVFPPKLSLALDVAGKTETIGDEEVKEEDETQPAVCPFSPGDVVSGVVSSERGQREGEITIDLANDKRGDDANSSPEPKTPTAATVRGVLPHVHLGDHASICGETLAATLTPGTTIERLLVVEVNRRGVPIVSMKPLLLSSVPSVADNRSEGGQLGDATGSPEAFIPTGVSDVSPGDLVAGFVSKVERFGVFVRFLCGYTGLAPRAMVADRVIEDPTGMFDEGDSVRCVVKRVDADTGRVALTLSRAVVPPSRALYLRSLLSETFAAHARKAVSSSNPEQEVTSPWGRLEFGTTCSAVVVAVKEYGVVLTASAGRSGKKKDGLEAKGGQLMVCALQHAPDGVEEGLEVKVRVLGMDVDKNVVDVTMDPDLVKAGRSKRQRSMVSLGRGEHVSIKIILAKPEAKHAVAASSDGRLFVLQVADFHCPHRTNQDAGLASASETDVKELACRVGDSFSPDGEGYWESEQGGTGASGCNPYAGAALIVPEQGDASGKRKGSRARKHSHEDLEVGSKTDVKQQVVAEDAMKTGRIALGNIVPGAQVVCEVISLHEDRLDVKVAVRYPKSYGPSTGKARSSSMDEGDEEQEESEAVEQTTDTEKKKRRREDTEQAADKKGAEKSSKGSGPNRKSIVRIRAKVHCTAAGMPGNDAPSEAVHSIPGKGGMTFPEWHPLAKYHVGQVLKAKVLRSEDRPGKKNSNLVFRLLELGVVEDVAEADEGGDGKESSPAPRLPWWNDNNPKIGEVHRGVITEVTDHGVLVSLSSDVRGLLPLGSLGTDLKNKPRSRTMFLHGMGLRVLVRRVDKKQHRVRFSLAGVPSADVLPDSSLPAISPDFTADEGRKSDTVTEKKTKAEKGPTSPASPSSGELVEGKMALSAKPWRPPCLMVRLKKGIMGRVCFTELADQDKWKKDPLAKFLDRHKVKCRVMPPLETRDRSSEAAATSVPLELSMRPSRLDSEVDEKTAVRREKAPAVGSIVKCYVVDTGKSGCFVRLAGGVSGRVLLKQLSDRYVCNPAAEFPRGRLVMGKVLAKDEATGQVSLTLQSSAVPSGGKAGGLSWDSKSLKKGLKVKGRVTSVKDFGIFVQFEDSAISGMCHRSEAADHEVTDLTAVYDEGDLVKAIVLRVDKKRKRLSLGLKASYFDGDPESSSDSEQEEGEDSDADRDVEDGRDQFAEDSDEKDITLDETRFSEKGKAVVVQAMEDSDSDRVVEDGSEDESGSETEKPAKRVKGVLGVGLSGASGTGGSSAFSLNFGDFSVGGEGASSDDDESSDDDSDAGQAGGKSHRSRKKAKERREEEERTVARERALEDDDATPETAGDFERLLIAAPNDSFLWVKFMAFKLSLADVDGARAVAERALKAISFREEQERYNLWVSLLNLEHRFGTGETLKKASERACQNCNPKKIYLHVAEMHDKAQETEQCEEVFQAAAKKFRHSKKVWTAYQLFRLRRGDDSGAREILQRSLQSLARHKHVSVISRFAQNEFEHGSVERGRSIFEGLMASYPKRLDLWNVYLDKEVKAGDMRAARNLLERLTGMDFNAKRMKGVFKKFLQFEMDHGDEAGVESVKAKATEYVASLAGNPGVAQR